MGARAKRGPGTEPTCLYPDEGELALVLLGPERAHMWPAIAQVEERVGLPRVMRQYGGRYWPAVRAFFDRRHSATGEPVAQINTGAGEDMLDVYEERYTRAKAAKAQRRSN